MAIIRITDLRLSALIGIFDWERKNKQDIVINITLEYNADKAAESDNIKDTVDYKIITEDVIKLVESSQYFLIEKLANKILDIALKNPLVLKATVRIDKPDALEYADSVSVEISKNQK